MYGCPKPTGGRRSEIALLQPAVDRFPDGLGQTSDFAVSGHIHIFFGRTWSDLVGRGSPTGAPDVYRPGIGIAGQRAATLAVTKTLSSRGAQPPRLWFGAPPRRTQMRQDTQNGGQLPRLRLGREGASHGARGGCAPQSNGMVTAWTLGLPILPATTPRSLAFVPLCGMKFLRRSPLPAPPSPLLRIFSTAIWLNLPKLAPT